MKKPNELCIVLCLIVFACGTNFFVHQASRLEHTVFLVHAYAMEQTQKTTLRFYYIQNREDSADIIAISFPEWQTETVECTNLRQKEYGTYGRYSIQSVLVDFLFSVPIETPVTLKKMQIQWSNGETTTEDIGTIYFFPSQTENWFDVQAASSDNQGIANYTGVVQEDVALLELKIPLDNYFADTLQIQQNNTILQLPQKLSAGTQWQIQTKFMLPEKDERRHMVIQIQPALVAQYADGTTSKWILYDSMTYEPDFSQWEVIHILYMRGVI